jgi:hypothetical protein
MSLKILKKALLTSLILFLSYLNCNAQIQKLSPGDIYEAQDTIVVLPIQDYRMLRSAILDAPRYVRAANKVLENTKQENKLLQERVERLSQDKSDLFSILVEKDLQIDTLSSGMQSIYQISSHTNQLLQQQTKKNILQVLL